MDAAQCLEILGRRGGCATGDTAHGEGCSHDAAPVADAPSEGDRNEAGPESLDSMSSTELVSAFHRAQSERVVAYKDYDAALNTMLRAEPGCERLGTSYPLLVAEMTARFAALSRAITLVATALQKRGQSELARLVRAVQNCEQQKLLLTAALHLERIRRSQAPSGTPPPPPRDLIDGTRALPLEPPEGPSADVHVQQVVGLLDEGSAAMERRIQGVVGEINELLDAVRCEAAEL